MIITNAVPKIKDMREEFVGQTTKELTGVLSRNPHDIQMFK